MANLKKNKKADIKTRSGEKFSYAYTDLATVNSYIESIGEKYYQYIETLTNSVTGELVDYIYTVRIDKDGKASEPMKGCRIMQGKTNSGNIAQEYNSGVTYARRYSLCLAYGLATEDDDGNSADSKGAEIKISDKQPVKKPAQPVKKERTPEELAQKLSPEQTDFLVIHGYAGQTDNLTVADAVKITEELKNIDDSAPATHRQKLLLTKYYSEGKWNGNIDAITSKEATNVLARLVTEGGKEE